MTQMVFESAAVGLPAVVILLVLARALDRVRRTTLVAPLIWASISLGAICAAEFITIARFSSHPAGALAALRYVAAITTFCPLMAVLGAKRPQDRAWQFIVAALICVLALPALQDLLYRYGQPVALHPAWQWFIAVLIVIEVANYLPTRYGASSVLFAAAQIVLMADYLPAGPQVAARWRVPIALGLTAVAGALPAVGLPRRRPAADRLARLRRDFRDWYGMLWALRVEQRASGPTVAGEGHANAATDEKEHAAIERTFVAHLKRFVSREWIATRLARATPAPPLQRDNDHQRPRSAAGDEQTVE